MQVYPNISKHSSEKKLLCSIVLLVPDYVSAYWGFTR